MRPRWGGSVPAGPLRCAAQVRAHGSVTGCVAELVGDRLQVRLEVPVRGVAPGQTVVLYDGDRVVGSATIEFTVHHPVPA